MDINKLEEHILNYVMGKPHDLDVIRPKNLTDIINDPPFGDDNLAEELVRYYKATSTTDKAKCLEKIKQIAESSSKFSIEEDLLMPNGNKDNSSSEELFSVLLHEFEGDMDNFSKRLSGAIGRIKGEAIETFSEESIAYQFSGELASAVKDAIWSPKLSEEHITKIKSLLADKNLYPYKTNVKSDVVVDAISSVFSDMPDEDKEKKMEVVYNFFKNKSFADLSTIWNELFKVPVNFSMEDFVKAFKEGFKTVSTLLIPVVNGSGMMGPGSIYLKDNSVFKVIDHNPNTDEVHVEDFGGVIDYYKGKKGKPMIVNYSTLGDIKLIKYDPLKLVKLDSLKIGDQFKLIDNPDTGILKVDSTSKLDNGSSIVKVFSETGDEYIIELSENESYYVDPVEEK